MKAIDLFAGAGGLSLAAYQCGIDIVAAIELDTSATATYKHNLVSRLNSGTKLINDDINSVDIVKLMNDVGIKKGEIDLILGGPPCQGFSTHRINNSGVDDPRNQLLLRYFDFIHEFRPKAFLVENVTGLLWKRHANYLNQFLMHAKNEGYNIQFCGSINAKEYGVPQNRKRVFILGTRNDLIDLKINFPPAPTHFAPNKGMPVWKSASSVFEMPPQEVLDEYIKIYQQHMPFEEAKKLVMNLEFGTKLSSNDTCNVHMRHTHDVAQRFNETPLNGSRNDIQFRLKCHDNNYEGHRDVYGRIIIDKPSNTITTGCNNPSKGRFVHPWLGHGITLRHAARLQTFPDDFEFLGNTSEQAKQIGNAVPVKLGQTLINSIKIAICP
jgi:DNA (cytosine-5)-methyltransferase 1